MSIPLSINGQVFEYPVDFDENWGPDATGWAQAVTNGMLQLQGGSFPITADINFGPNFGLLSKYFETRSALPATTGTVRLSSADAGVAWRNNANSGNLVLTTNSTDQLLYNGHPIASTSGGAVTSITGTANQVIASAATGDVTLSTPQNIAATSSPTFAALTLTAPLSVANGGTGDSSLTAYAVLCGGTTSTSPVQSVASVGSAGQVLTSNGAGALPTYQNTTGTGTVNSGTQYQIGYYATSSSTISGDSSITTNASNQLLLINGTNAIPSLSFTSDPDTGLYRVGANTLGFATNGTGWWEITSTGAFAAVSVGTTIVNNDGTAGAPTYTFADTASGLYHPSMSVVGISAGGTLSASFSATGVDVNSHKITSAAAATASGDVISYRQNGQAVNGSSANSSGTAGTVQQGTISTPDLRANAVTQIQSSASSGTAASNVLITSKSITTIGGPVLIVAMATFACTSASVLGAIGAAAHLSVLQGANPITGGQAFAFQHGYSVTSTHISIPISINVVDTPVAGTYTYNLYYDSGESVTSVVQYSLQLVELRA